MDDIFRKRSERESDYYVVMGNLAGRAAIEAGSTAARFIKYNSVKMKFANELEIFVENQLKIINGNYHVDKKKLALDYLKKEKDNLNHQEFLLKYKKVIIGISFAIEFVKDSVKAPAYYIVKAVGIYAGVAQIQAGSALVGGSYLTGPGAIVGNIAGVALIVHGFGAIEENLISIKRGNPNYKGHVRRGYEQAAITAGLTSEQGDILYGGVDLVLSGYGLFRNILKPDSYRLFRWVNTDTVIGFKDMNGPVLTMEMLIDGLTISAAYDTFESQKN
ncbi:DUF4225 domain-containing protein [Rahnella sp. PCH160]|uniref:DUF4225 domain-containing protein n=1 Tax=Rahnella sp. PCH160 TaxID=3447928 RepID=UPI0039FD060A